MSLRSTFVAVTVPLQVIVIAVPIVDEHTRSLFVALFPFSVKVPVIVWFALIDRVEFDVVVVVSVKEANVLAPVMLALSDPSVTMLYFFPSPAKVFPVAVFIVDPVVMRVPRKVGPHVQTSALIVLFVKFTVGACPL
jgi:hypothetical protein